MPHARKRTLIRFFSSAGTLSFLFFLLPGIASAHEVYVLSPAQITQALGMPPFDMIAVIRNNLGQFVFWASIGVTAAVFVFFISTVRFLERKIDPVLEKLRRFAPLVARVTVGLSFLAAAYYQANYGPELPITGTYGQYAGIVTVILVCIGIMTIFGLYARLAALIALAMYCVAVWFHGVYMITYVNYLGEIITLLALGAHAYSIDRWAESKRTPAAAPAFIQKIKNWVAPRSFAILRILFGTSLIYASAYAKVIYNNLALFTVYKYHLDAIFHFEAHFLVVLAAIIEIMIGAFIVIGFEIRFTCLFFLTFLMMSLSFFGEVVWPHIILIGIPIALIFYGYDKYSLEGYLARKKQYLPFL